MELDRALRELLMMFKQLTRLSLAACVVAAILAAPSLAGQTQAPPPTGGIARSPLIIKSLDGRDLYDFYCASCHGKTGRGDGPEAKKLKAAPPDLTALSAANGGQFPKDRVQTVLTGDRPSASHGTKEMPVWGEVFKFLDPSDQRAKTRVANLVAYLESFQAK
jgi:mono/diheme cytochrome c family protein